MTVEKTGTGTKMTIHRERNPITGALYITFVPASPKEKPNPKKDPTPTQDELPPVQESGKIVQRDLTHAGRADTAREEEDDRRASLLESVQKQKSDEGTK